MTARFLAGLIYLFSIVFRGNPRRREELRPLPAPVFIQGM
jgi:hypothetical protein